MKIGKKTPTARERKKEKRRMKTQRHTHRDTKIRSTEAKVPTEQFIRTKRQKEKEGTQFERRTA